MGLGTFSGYYVVNAWFLPFRVFDPRHGDVQTPGIVEDFSHPVRFNKSAKHQICTCVGYAESNFRTRQLGIYSIVTFLQIYLESRGESALVWKTCNVSDSRQ